MRNPNQRKPKMADFDTFDEDPAADFLAREKEDLGELVDETLGSGQNVTGVSFDSNPYVAFIFHLAIVLSPCVIRLFPLLVKE